MRKCVIDDERKNNTCNYMYNIRIIWIDRRGPTWLKKIWLTGSFLSYHVYTRHWNLFRNIIIIWLYNYVYQTVLIHPYVDEGRIKRVNCRCKLFPSKSIRIICTKLFIRKHMNSITTVHAVWRGVDLTRSESQVV